MQMSTVFIRVNLLIPKIDSITWNTLGTLLLDMSSELWDENSSP